MEEMETPLLSVCLSETQQGTMTENELCLTRLDIVDGPRWAFNTSDMLGEQQTRTRERLYPC